MATLRTLKYLSLLAALILLILALSSCDNTFLDIYTRINPDYSGTRTVELSVKTQYLQKGEIILEDNESIYDMIIASLPKGKVETYEKEGYTYFKSTVEFDDINFLQHVSIDNYSESTPERFYAKMEIEDYFFHSNYHFSDYVDMEIDSSLIEAQGEEGQYYRLANLFGADDKLLAITYQVKFPVKIISSSSDLIGEDNIAIWNLKYGDKKDIFIEGRRIKYLTYILVGVLGLVGLFVIFLIFILIYSRKRRRIIKTGKTGASYDNYFKKDKYFSSLDDN
ncbi:MAG: hypothetical protein FJW66_04965 [Actinobacteria bacterium]|nr:hypothetical protein [Actinomycetota bacterium]